VSLTTDDLLDPAFVGTTALQPDASVPGRFHADYDERWSSLRGVHGGYQTAIAVRAAEALAPGRTIRTVTASFLRPGRVGPAVLDVDVVRSTRTFTTAIVTVRQDERPVLTVRTTAIDAVVGHEWATPNRDRPAPFELAVPFTPPPEVPHFRQAELRLDPATIPRSDADDARVAGYVRPNEGRRLDAAWLVMAGDWFPPSPFRRVPIPVGGVSVDYTVHVHRTVTLGPDEWLEAVFETPNSTAGLGLEHGSLATQDGVLVAETFHTRWTG
jgi:acyl-CoA thioesterase